MSSFIKVEVKDAKTVGFIVQDEYYSGVYYVESDKLFLSNISVMLKGNYVSQCSEWYEIKLFPWGEKMPLTLIRKFRQLIIEEVSEVPDWVGKDYEVVRKEIASLAEELRKESWFYKITHFLAKKGDK